MYHHFYRFPLSPPCPRPLKAARRKVFIYIYQDEDDDVDALLELVVLTFELHRLYTSPATFLDAPRRRLLNFDSYVKIYDSNA